MNERTRERLRAIAEKEFPGCAVEVQADGSLFRIVQDGKVLSKHPPLMKYADFDRLTDAQLRQIVLGICAP
jgi:hypothetical protein